MKNLIKGPVKYDGYTYIFDADGHMLMQVRGWGWIQYLPDAAAKQDAIGQFVADAINEKLTKTKTNERTNVAQYKVTQGARKSAKENRF